MRVSHAGEQVALAILTEAESWEWPITQCIQQSGNQGGKYNAITPRLLSALIIESQRLGGTVLDQFWYQLGNCHPDLKKNGEFQSLSSDFSSTDLLTS
jgi:hypothetical protein